VKSPLKEDGFAPILFVWGLVLRIHTTDLIFFKRVLYAKHSTRTPPSKIGVQESERLTTGLSSWTLHCLKFLSLSSKSNSSSLSVTESVKSERHTGCEVLVPKRRLSPSVQGPASPNFHSVFRFKDKKTPRALFIYFEKWALKVW
jgi:hypothetical protein